MSSFRIDRQYVSFQTAETEPVHATPQAEKQSRLENTVAPPTVGADLSRLYDEIYEKLLREHSEQAEYILSKASDEAQEIIENAKRQAADILSQARTEAARLQDELRTTVENDASERRVLERKELLTMETALKDDYATAVDKMQSEIVPLVMEIVRKVIAIKLSQTDEVFMGLVKDALEQLKQTGSVAIHVSTDDYLRYFGTERGDTLDTGEMKVVVVEEPEFKTGDLVVESEGEIIDLSVDRQIDQIEKAFLKY